MRAAAGGGAGPEGEAPASGLDPDEDVPPWVRRELEKKAAEGSEGDLPFGVYLLLSSVVAIAATGSIFEFFNKNAIFGVIEPDSPLWAPILGFFVLTGFPLAGVLWSKSIDAANRAAEAQDRADGY